MTFLDPRRLERIHFINVYVRSGDYIVILSDKSEVTWDEWVSFVRDDIRKEKSDGRI